MESVRNITDGEHRTMTTIESIGKIGVDLTAMYDDIPYYDPQRLESFDRLLTQIEHLISMEQEQ